MAQNGTFDYVIVGAGSAGCTLAMRLSEDGARVLVLEAGGWDRDPWIRIPLGWGRILTNRMHDWMYFTEPEPTMDGRRIECARGKVIGGSSSINAMAYVRGHRADYDRWAAAGLPAWSYAHVLPYFRRQESWEGGASAFRGGDGPLTTRYSTYADPLVEAYLAAGQAAGFPLVEDYNGAQQEGFARLQSTIRDGRRCSLAVAYLRPAMARENVTVEVAALAARVVLEGSRAVGVEYLQRGQRITARANREVILAGGVINSPQLLMLSGIGDPAELTPHGIAVKVPLRGVGKNLQDHISAGIVFARNEPGPLQRAMRLDRIAGELAKAYVLGKGIATDLPSGSTAFIRTGDASVPNVQYLLVAAPFDAAPYLPPFKPAFADSFSVRIVVLRPESRGTIRLASADPQGSVRIQQNFLSHESERRQLRDGIRIMREIARQAPLHSFIAREAAPGAAASSDAEIDAYVRATGVTVHHPLGTCKMGPDADADAVVDAELRVRGVERLRVVDASVMPDLVGGNINAPVVMVAEMAADLIRGRLPLAPVNV
ncbi:MAG TPA: choline dehydrogenase [Stellaceae bacterium]|nr:choline dehydrogenase [Stellaceae bacterium]